MAGSEPQRDVEEIDEIPAQPRRKSSLTDLLQEDDIRAMVLVFESLDKNGDKHLSKDELSKVLHQQLKQRFAQLKDDAAKREEIIAAILESADTDADGVISLEEFIQSYYSNAGVLPLDFIHEKSQRLQSRLSKEEVEKLKEAFQSIDADGDGFITVDELDKLVGECLFGGEDQAVREEVLATITLVSDQDGDGRLNLTEFIRSFARREGVAEMLHAAQQVSEIRETMQAIEELQEQYTQETVRKIARMFSHLDVNNDQYLEREELEKLMHKLLKERVPDLAKDEDGRNNLINTIISAADTDKDGRISLDEFIQSFMDGCGVLPLDYVQEQADKVTRRLTKEEVEALKQVFKEVDEDDNGLITVDELEELLGRMLPHLEAEERRQVSLLIIAASDKNADGQVDLTEFIRSFVREEGIGALVPVICAAAAADEEVAEANAGGEGEDAPPPPTAGAVAEARPPATPEDVSSPFKNDVSGVSFTDAQLKREFKKFDRDNSGSISRKEFKHAYMKMEWCGLEPTERQVDELMDRFSGGDDKLIYEEFCVLMLYRARM